MRLPSSSFLAACSIVVACLALRAPLQAQQPPDSHAPAPHDSVAHLSARAERANSSADPRVATTVAALLSAVDSVRRELSALRSEVAALRAERDARRAGSARGAGTDGGGMSTGAARSADAPTAVPVPTAVARGNDDVTSPAYAPQRPQAPAAPQVEAGFGSLKFDGLLQTQYANGSQRGDNTLRIRRAELKLSGKVAPHISWAVMIDPAKSLSLRQSSASVGGTQVVTDESVNQSSRTLQDALVTIGLDKGYSVDVGQYKLPFAYEGPNPTSQVVTVERPQFASDRARGGSLGDVRDIGVTLRGSVWPNSKLAVGFFDGTGEAQNATDANDQKVVVANLATPVPFLSGLTLGMSGVYGGSPNSEHARRDRIGALAEFLRPSFTARAEYIRGVDGDVHREGYYEVLAYKVNKTIELVQRVDFFDPDVRHVGSFQDEGATDVLAGLNYYIAGHNAKLQLNAVTRSWRHHRFAATRQLLLNLQTAW